MGSLVGLKGNVHNSVGVNLGENLGIFGIQGNLGVGIFGVIRV